MDSEQPKLRMAPVESSEDLAHRVEREQRVVNLHRQSALETSMDHFRVGSVQYLNAVPLTRGIEDNVFFTTPSELGRLLRNDQLDAAMVSVTEVLHHDRYDVLDGIAIASLGEVQSVLLAHRRPLEEITSVHCDRASLTSVNLLRVLLAERGLHPEFKDLESYDGGSRPDSVLLIGDRALDLFHEPGDHSIWDLGSAWYELTGLPFVYAVWAMRRGLDQPAELRRILRDARDFGMDTLDTIIRERTEYTYEFRKDYLSWHIHYHMGTDEKRGLKAFIDLLRKHDSRPVYDPVFVV